METKAIYIINLRTFKWQVNYMSERKTTLVRKDFDDVITYLRKHYNAMGTEHCHRQVDIYVFHMNEKLVNTEDDKQLTKRIRDAIRKFKQNKALYNPEENYIWIASLDTEKDFILDEMIGDLDRYKLKIAFNLVEAE